MLRIFTDGACSSNPGPGGWAAVFNLKNGYKIISGNEIQTTNNRMELMGVLKALEIVEQKGFDDVEIHSDSAYVVNGITNGWIKVWKRNDWKTSKKEDVKNKDLWQSIDALLTKLLLIGAKIIMVKVKGHSGNTFNEIADKAAVAEVSKVKNI